MVTSVQKQTKRVKIRPIVQPPRPPYHCLNCYQKKNAPTIGYVRLVDLRVFVPMAYAHLTEEHMLALVSRDEISFLQRLLDYDRMVDWVRTTTIGVVGVGRQGSCNHPVSRYLHESYKLRRGIAANFQLYSSACEAFKDMRHISHTRYSPLCTNAALLPSGEVSLMVYCPLPTWTNAPLASLAALPGGCRITREMFLTMLRARH